jgi:hypothetical protein
VDFSAENYAVYDIYEAVEGDHTKEELRGGEQEEMEEQMKKVSFREWRGEV